MVISMSTETRRYYPTLADSESATLAAVAYSIDLMEEGEQVEITVGPRKKSRSLNQNALMWKWLGELAEQIKKKSGESYSTDDLHEYFKARFCPAKELRFGEKVIYATSTTRLDKGEMHHYMNQLHEWSVNAGFKLTTPDDCEYRKLRNG